MPTNDKGFNGIQIHASSASAAGQAQDCSGEVRTCTHAPMPSGLLYAYSRVVIHVEIKKSAGGHFEDGW